jgi:hypothetical protein
MQLSEELYYAGAAVICSSQLSKSCVACSLDINIWQKPHSPAFDFRQSCANPIHIHMHSLHIHTQTCDYANTSVREAGPSTTSAIYALPTCSRQHDHIKRHIWLFTAVAKRDFAWWWVRCGRQISFYCRLLCTWGSPRICTRYEVGSACPAAPAHRVKSIDCSSVGVLWPIRLRQRESIVPSSTTRHCLSDRSFE